jgi:hypothetical protein
LKAGRAPGICNAKGQHMNHPGRQPDADPQAADAASGTWEAIEPYQPRPGFWRGRAQVTDGHTTQSELCDHPWLSKSRPGHDDQSAAWACGQELAATLRAEHIALDSTLAAQVRAALEGKFGADAVTDEMVRSTVHGLIGGGSVPACGQDHTYLVVDPGDPPLYEGTNFDRAYWEAAQRGFTSDGVGSFRAHVTACHRDTRTCQGEETRVRRAALDYWLAGWRAATPGDSPAAEAAPGSATPAGAIAAGDLVISWYDSGPVQYGGPDDRGRGHSTLSCELLGTSAPVRECDPARVAPADIPIPAQDARVNVAKRPRTEMPNGAAGPWRLTLPGVTQPSWHRLQRDAVAAGLRRLAILDWHATRAAQAETE